MMKRKLFLPIAAGALMLGYSAVPVQAAEPAQALQPGDLRVEPGNQAEYQADSEGRRTAACAAADHAARDLAYQVHGDHADQETL